MPDKRDIKRVFREVDISGRDAHNDGRLSLPMASEAVERLFPNLHNQPALAVAISTAPEHDIGMSMRDFTTCLQNLVYLHTSWHNFQEVQAIAARHGTDLDSLDQAEYEDACWTVFPPPLTGLRDIALGRFSDLKHGAQRDTALDQAAADSGNVSLHKFYAMCVDVDGAATAQEQVPALEPEENRYNVAGLWYATGATTSGLGAGVLWRAQNASKEVFGAFAESFVLFQNQHDNTITGVNVGGVDLFDIEGEVIPATGEVRLKQTFDDQDTHWQGTLCEPDESTGNRVKMEGTWRSDTQSGTFR